MENNKSQYNKEWYQKNKMHVKDYNKKYKSKHKVEVSAYKKRYNKLHEKEIKEKSSIFHKQYYAKNRKNILNKSQRYYRENKEKVKLSNAMWKNKNKIKMRKYNTEWQKKRRAEYKQKVYEHYGKRCMCKGCKIDEMKFLSIDHMKNDGARQRKTIHGGQPSLLYAYLVKNNFPVGYQILCHNCNHGKYLNGGICPREGREH